MSNINNRQNNNLHGMMGMGRQIDFYSKQNSMQPRNKHIILKIVLFIWFIFTVSSIVSVIQEKKVYNNSIEVTALVTDCIMHETWDEDAGTSVYYTTYVRWTLDKTYEGKTTLSQRHKEGDYITINISSEDNSKIVTDVNSVSGSIFVMLCVSFSVLLVIIVIHEQFSK